MSNRFVRVIGLALAISFASFVLLHYTQHFQTSNALLTTGFALIVGGATMACVSVYNNYRFPVLYGNRERRIGELWSGVMFAIVGFLMSASSEPIILLILAAVFVALGAIALPDMARTHTFYSMAKVWVALFGGILGFAALASGTVGMTLGSALVMTFFWVAACNMKDSSLQFSRSQLMHPDSIAE